jgi:membrane-associated phospholipid phosphatase
VICPPSGHIRSEDTAVNKISTYPLILIFSAFSVLFANVSFGQSPVASVQTTPDTAQISTDPGTEQKPPATDTQKPPAAVGEEGKKPTGQGTDKPARGFVSALAHNLGDDVKHIPRRNSLYWLGGGAALALAVHPEDQKINAHLVSSSSDKLWVPGHIIGNTYLILGAAGATYIFGRTTDSPRTQHMGMDLIEASLLSEGLVEGMKVIARRDRPVQINGGTQSKTYSFPSGHAAITFAAATVFQQHMGYKAAIPTYLVASYVAMSRLHDNRHYASDVIFGAATGIVVGRSVTWHGRNFYASPMLVPGGAGIQLMAVR